MWYYLIKSAEGRVSLVQRDIFENNEMENGWVNKLGNFMEYRLTFFCDVEGKVICSEGEGFVWERRTEQNYKGLK